MPASAPLSPPYPPPALMPAFIDCLRAHGLLRLHGRECAAALSRGVADEGTVALVGERQQAGRAELRWADGSRLVRFSNGTEKERRPDGTTIIRYPNGDVQRGLPPGGALIELYFYASTASLQGTFAADGAQAFAFASGQLEVLHADGRKEAAQAGL